MQARNHLRYASGPHYSFCMQQKYLTTGHAALWVLWHVEKEWLNLWGYREGCAVHQGKAQSQWVLEYSLSTFSEVFWHAPLPTPPPRQGLSNTKIDAVHLSICIKIQTQNCTQKATTVSSRIRREETQPHLGSTVTLPMGGIITSLLLKSDSWWAWKLSFLRLLALPPDFKVNSFWEWLKRKQVILLLLLKTPLASGLIIL